MNNCDCKHKDICIIKDPENCKQNNDPWCKPDNKIMGMTTREINRKQGIDEELK